MAGVLLIAVGAACYFWALHELSRANAASRIPMWAGLPPHNPPRTYVLRIVGVILVGAGSFVVTDSLGYWGLLVLLPVVVPPMARLWMHNRAVERRGQDPAVDAPR